MDESDYSSKIREAMIPIRKRISASEAKIEQLLVEGRITSQRAEYARQVLGVTDGLAEARAALSLGNIDDFVDCCSHIKLRIQAINYLSPEESRECWERVNRMRYVNMIKRDLGQYIDSLNRKAGEEGRN